MATHNCHGRHFLTLSITIIITSCHLPVAVAQGNNASQPVRFSVPEKSAPGTLVGSVFNSFHLADLYPDPADQANLAFSFRFSSSDSSYFSINESTGIVTTSSVRIDRDVICAYVTSCVLQFQVQILPPRYFQVFNVFVVVVDVNDHTPTFTPSSIRINVSESDSPGKLFLLPGADDPDGGIDGIQGYRLEPNSTKFQLVVGSLADGSSDVRLRLMERLKRSEVSSYSLVVLAFDGGQPPRTGSLAIGVTVLDSSSSSSSSSQNLVFENSTYEASVAENLAAGTSVLQVRAFYQGASGGDSSGGAGGQITYGIDRSTQQNQPMYFVINNRTGVVSVSSPLDHEKQSVVLVTLTATDRSRPTSLPAYARVTFHVTDSNDNAPSITVTTLTEDGVAEVATGAPLDSFVAYIGVTDADEGVSGQFNCTVNSTAFRLEPVYTDYKLKTAVKFDRAAQYAVAVTCVDRGSPALTSSVVVAVRVTSRGPAFVADRTQVDVFEGNRVGDTIVVLNVTSDPSEKEPKLSFGCSPLGDSPPAAVSVDVTLGVVTSNVVFRFDVRRQYSYVVTVSDVRAATSATATSTLIVNVLQLSPNTGSSTPAGVGVGGVTPVATPDSQAAAGIKNTDTVIIAAVVCATVIVVVITVVVAAAIVCYRRNQQKALVSAAVQLANGPSSVCSDGTSRLVRSVSSVSSSNGSANGEKRDSKLGSIREESFEELHSSPTDEWPPNLPNYPAIPSTIGLDSSFGVQPKKGIYIRSVSHPENHQQQQQQQHNHHHHRRRRSARTVRYNDRMAEDGSDASRATDGESSSCCSGSLTDSGRGFSLQDDSCLATAVNGNAQQYPHSPPPPPPSQVLRQDSDCSGASSTRPLVSSQSSASTQKYPIENKIYITNHFRDALPRHSARVQPGAARRDQGGGPHQLPGRTEPRRRSDYFDARSRASSSTAAAPASVPSGHWVDPLRAPAAPEGVAPSTGYRDTGEYTRCLYGGQDNVAFVRGTSSSSSRKNRTKYDDESAATVCGPSRGYLTAAAPSSSGDEAPEFAANGGGSPNVDGHVCDTFV